MDRSTRRLGIALAVSVGLNLFLVGAVSAHFLRGTGGPPPERDSGHFLFRATEGLSESGRTKVRSIVRQHRSELAPRRRSMREARREIQSALSAEPFERQRLEKALGKLHGETSKAQLALHATLAEAAEQLTPEDRKQLAEAAGRFRRRGGPPRRR